MYDPYEYREIELLENVKVNVDDIVSIGYKRYDDRKQIMIWANHHDPFRRWQSRTPPWSLFFKNKDETLLEFARTKKEEDAIHYAYVFASWFDKPVITDKPVI